jgi:hypothetical protein
MSKLDNIKKNLKGETSEFFQKYLDFLKKYQELKITEESDLISSTSLNFDKTPNLARLSKGILTASEEINSENESYNLSKVYKDIEFFIEYFKNKRIERVEYGLIYKIVLSVKNQVPNDEESDSDIFDNFLQLVKEQLLNFITNCEVNGTIQKYEKYIICFYKIIEHTILANMQYAELYLSSEKQIEDLNITFSYVSESVDELFNDVNTQILGIKNQTDDLEKNTDKLENRITNFNTEIISILGVFSAFVFVMFGGFDALAKILEGLQDSDISIFKTLIISSILISFLITILYSLMYWISIIIEKPILQKSCTCKEACWNLKHIYARHRFYLTLMIICAIVFLFSCLLLVLNPSF